jgi:hypothetical protein
VFISYGELFGSDVYRAEPVRVRKKHASLITALISKELLEQEQGMATMMPSVRNAATADPGIDMKSQTM